MKKAFTLIELLVVIAIISALAALVTNTASVSLKKSRDSQRKSDLQTLKKALLSAQNNCKGKAYTPFALDNGSTKDFGYTHYSSINYYLFYTGNLKKQLWDPQESQENISRLDAWGNVNLDTTNDNNGHFGYKFYDGHVYEASFAVVSNVCVGPKSSNYVHGGQTDNMWLFRVKLEMGNSDAEAGKSFAQCQKSIGNQVFEDDPMTTGNDMPSSTDGYYYVCD